ncbi:MAG: radical SAM protein [Candidatus Brocadiaceae bacterium]|nr:radical SAM protein [Candidatus Brocadiaceae bacterium]
MSSHILLINPWVHDFTAFDLWAKPLGLLYIASTLRHYGYEVHLVDCLYQGRPVGSPLQVNQRQKPYGIGYFQSQEIEKPPIFRGIPRRFKRYGMPPEEFMARLVGARCNVPLLVCVTSHMTYWYPGVFEAIRMVKSVFPSVPVALGGIYASLCHGHARENSGADYVVKGPGEVEVLKLADRLCKRERDYGRVKTWIEEWPLPAYDLYQDLASVSMLTSRGCPFRCTYCASFLLGPSFLRRGPEGVAAEIGYYVNELGVEDIAFYDDALLVDSERHIIPILELLIKKGLKVRFHTPNGLHPRYIDLSLARLLREAGFSTLRLGFEGTSLRVQGASGHKVNNQELERALGCLRAAGYSTRDIGVYLLVGLPGQTVEEVAEAMELVNGLGARIKLAEYSPIPGTEEFKGAAALCPQVTHEPLSHNKSTFVRLRRMGMGIDYGAFEGLKSLAKRLNDGLADGGGTLQRAPTMTVES